MTLPKDVDLDSMSDTYLTALRDDLRKQRQALYAQYREIEDKLNENAKEDDRLTAVLELRRVPRQEAGALIANVRGDFARVVYDDGNDTVVVTTQDTLHTARWPRKAIRLIPKEKSDEYR